MTITFANEDDVIVYALEKKISYARNNQYIFLAQSIWWISSIIGLQQGLIIHIGNLKIRSDIRESEKRLEPANQSERSAKLWKDLPDSDHENHIIHPDRIKHILLSSSDHIDSGDESVSTTETDIHNEVINNCELFLEQSKQESKAIGRKNRQVSTLVKKKVIQKNRKIKPVKTFGTQTEGIDGLELQRRKAAGECQRCAWPQDRNGGHKTLDCFRWKKIEKGTVPVPKNKKYKQD
jgi:hypothetical protein